MEDAVKGRVLVIILTCVVLLEAIQVMTFIYNAWASRGIYERLNVIQEAQRQHVAQPVHPEHECTYHGVCGG